MLRSWPLRFFGFGDWLVAVWVLRTSFPLGGFVGWLTSIAVMKQSGILFGGWYLHATMHLCFYTLNFWMTHFLEIEARWVIKVPTLHVGLDTVCLPNNPWEESSFSLCKMGWFTWSPMCKVVILFFGLLLGEETSRKCVNRSEWLPFVKLFIRHQRRRDQHHQPSESTPLFSIINNFKLQRLSILNHHI